ncbi:MAG: extracellular solute-binding protein [Bacilli bacterium]|nr:extracellular solute-binding protein [Bacilli bacterium]
MTNKKLFIPMAMALLLAACNGAPSTGLSTPTTSSDESSSSPATTSSDESSSSPATTSSQTKEHKEDHVMETPTEIYFMSNFSYQSTIEKIIEAFKEVEPNITVHNVKETGGYDDVRNKVISQLATQEHPDMFVGYPDSVQEVMQYGAVVKLDNYMNDEVYGWSAKDKKDIIQAYMSEGQMYPLPGTYSLPFAKSTEAMYYNKTVLIGLDLKSIDPTINDGAALSVDYLNDLTWEELFDHLIPALKAYDDAQDAEHKILTGTAKAHHIFGYDSDDNLFITLAEQYGYGYTSIDEYGEGHLDFINDGMKGLMKTFKKAYDSTGFFTKGTNNNEYTNYTFTDSSCLFSVGSTGGSKYQVSADFDTGVARIPHAEGEEPKVINQGPSLAILKHDDNRALASWLFYRFLSNKLNAATWAMETGYAPIRYSVLEDGDYQDFVDESTKTPRSEEQIKAAVASYMGQVGPDMYSSPVFKGSAQARVEVGALLSNCLLSQNLDGEIDTLFQTAYDNTLKKM